MHHQITEKVLKVVGSYGSLDETFPQGVPQMFLEFSWLTPLVS
jgi:hypothetical protein